MKTTINRSIITASAVIITMNSFSQDVITFKNGDEKKVKVTEILPTEVKYKSFENPDGPVYSESKSKIFMIKYENGYKEVMNTVTAKSVEPTIVQALPATPPAQVKQFEKEITTPMVLTIKSQEDLMNRDLIVTAAGDSLRCNIEVVTNTVISYRIARSGADTRADIQMYRVQSFYRSTNKSSFTPVVYTQPIPTPVVKNDPVQTAVDEDEFLPQTRSYGGPRMGATLVGPGLFRDALSAEGKRNLYSQFGWQFEKRLFTTKTGISSMVEFVPMLGGLDMGKCIPSASLLLGVRVKNGLELGAGPNAAVYGYKDAQGFYNASTSFGIVFAAGMSFKSDKVYFPVNIAFIPSVGKKVNAIDPETNQPYRKQVETGAKVSVLVGFNYRKK